MHRCGKQEKIVELSCGVDIIEIDRVKQAIEKDKERFLDRVFTENEIKYCSKSISVSYQHYAARFAAKEAVAKALGLGLAGGIKFTEIEILNNKMGKPEVFLQGETKKIAEGLRINSLSLSISHCKDYAVANVVCFVNGMEA